jgi:hypothetical protein
MTKMKNNFLKYYIVAAYFCTSVVLFAQPESNDTTGTLETPDAAPAPIDNYVWVLALVGLALVFMKVKANQNKENARLLDK